MMLIGKKSKDKSSSSEKLKSKKHQTSVIKFTFTRRVYFLSRFLLRTTLLSIVILFVAVWFWNRELLYYFNEKFVVSQIDAIDNRVFCNNVSISGNINYIEYDNILYTVNEALDCDNTVGGKEHKNRSFNEILKYIKRNLSKNPWLKKVEIYRDLPNKLIIRISEHTPFAMWQNNNKLQVINEKGEVIGFSDIIDDFDYLVILVGENANLHIDSLKSIINSDIELGNQIYSATWVGDRRWDIKLNNGVVIKLPRDNFLEAWQKFVEFYHIPGSAIDLKKIDLRVNDKIFLEYNENIE